MPTARIHRLPRRTFLGVGALALGAAALAVRTRSELGGLYAGLGRAHPDPAPVLAPERALATITTAEPLRVALAAAEPLVQAPIAGQFDEDGRLWVVEMPTYMRDLAGTGETEPGSRIVV